MRQPGLPVASGDRAIARMNQKGDEMMKSEIKEMYEQLNDENREIITSLITALLFYQQS